VSAEYNCVHQKDWSCPRASPERNDDEVDGGEAYYPVQHQLKMQHDVASIAGDRCKA
jgi:hypothetical protein